MRLRVVCSAGTLRCCYFSFDSISLHIFTKRVSKVISIHHYSVNNIIIRALEGIHHGEQP